VVTQLDPELFLTVDQLLAAVGAGLRPVVVDTRTPQAFTAAHIPGSINVPLAAVGSKEFFRGWPLVLVNEGYEALPLERACRRLRQAGARAHVLAGGLRLWQGRGGTLEGTNPTGARWSEVPPRVLFAERGCGRWLVVVADSAPRHEAAWLAPAPTFSCPAAAGELASCIRRALLSSGNLPYVALLVATGDGSGHGRLESDLQRAGLGDVFFLEGGLAAYREHLHLQGGVVRQRRTSRAIPKGCGGCP
jgi:rhodanese-related sulfurtransferase